MIILNKEEAERLVLKAEESFKLAVKPDLLSIIVLVLTFRLNHGVEFFAIGPWEARYPFIFIYGKLMSAALNKNYRVIVKKEGSLFNNAEWYLEFIKK